MAKRSRAPDARVEIAEQTLREVVEELARYERPPCSAGERRAAEWIARRLRDAGCQEVVTEEEPSWGPWPPTLTGLGAVSLYASLQVVRRHRMRGGLLALAALAGLLDEIENGPRVLRKTVRTKKKTVNVIAETGDRRAARTLVVLAHHDAAQTGAIFDQSWARGLYERYPQLTSKSKFQIPQWWAGVAAPLVTALAALTGSRRLARRGLLISALATAAVADIARSPVVPGANDNLSAVAALVAVAELLRERPIDGVRVLLVSCGAEETFQDGIRAFLARHSHELPPNRTSFLNLDTIGSSDLIMFEGEGPVWMEEYAHPGFRDLVARAALDAGVGMERGLRARASTDAVIPSRAGYPTATLLSFMPWRMPANYHLMSDVPENLDYTTVADATRVVYAVARSIASGD